MCKKDLKVFVSDDKTEVAAAITACKMANVEHKIYKKGDTYSIEYKAPGLVQNIIDDFMKIYREVKKQL